MSATIGIDFGTSFCSASWINPATGKPEAVRFKDTELFKIPSVVYISPKGTVIVGQSAFENLEDAQGLADKDRDEIINNTITSIKTHLDKRNITRRPNKSYSDEDIVALILKKVKEQVEESCQIEGSIEGLVLTYPVNFDESPEKKEILTNAAALAGFKNVKLLQEPVSAAIYAIKMGLVPSTCKGLLIYDFGAGTFDIAYLQPKGKEDPYMPILPKGDGQCGGDDVDRELYLDWDKYVKATKGRSVSEDPAEFDKVFQYRCRREKEKFSRGNVANYIAEYIPRLGRVQREITTGQFNKLTEPWVNRTIDKTKQILKEIEAANLPLEHLILIGGSSRLPLVKTKLESLLKGKAKIVSTGDMDIAVAVGAMYSVGMTINGPQKPVGSNQTAITKHFCVHCGKQVISNQKFCMHCGKENYSYKE